MKTPREILLARHQTAAPRLDAIRREVVRELNHKETKEQSWLEASVASLLGCPKTIWRELILPSRRVWTGLAAVWVLVFAINLSQRDTVSGVTGKPVRSQAVMMSWQAQQRWMNELLADRAATPDAARPKNLSPKPRTETNETMTA